MKLKRAILNFSVRFRGLNSCFGGMFRKQKCSLGSYLIVGNEESEKNQFANFLGFVEDFGEVAFLEFDFTEWAELALSIQLIVNSNRII